MFLSNFTHLAGPSVLLKLGPLLKIELIAENGAFSYIKNINLSVKFVFQESFFDLCPM